RVRPLPVQQLSVRHPVDHSSSDSSSRHSSSDHSSPDLPSTSAGPSRKRRKSPMTSVPALPLTTEGIQREQGRRIVGVESADIALTERVAGLERDNQRLRGIASVESQRVDRGHPERART
nr:hypothetical protein [Tanacetum cinerariifolium]